MRVPLRAVNRYARAFVGFVPSDSFD